MEGKEIIKILDKIKVLIKEDEIEKAIGYIDEAKKIIETKSDKASDYMDELLNEIK